MISFGSHLRALRVEARITLRQFCSDTDFDPGNYSRIERGLLNPPTQHAILRTWALTLGLREASKEWIQFFDLAAISSGKLPNDLLDDEAVLNKLPLLFRTVRNRKVSDEDLRELIEMIRRD